MRIRSLISGLFSYLPGGNWLIFKRRKARSPNTGTSNARYCYSIWLRHLVLANKHGLIKGVPREVAEIGPGKSIGAGLAALLSGAKRYYALDLVNHTTSSDNLFVFSQLIELFRKREKIPDNLEFPDLIGELDCYDFPSYIISDEVLNRSLEVARLDQIRNEILEKSYEYPSRNKYIIMVVPWYGKSVIKSRSIDMIFSNQVMEHIDDLKTSYSAAHSWLKKDGVMSSEIDFSCHGHAEKWNGHWTYSKFSWKLIRGNRPYFINREPLSVHVKLIAQNRFSIITSIIRNNHTGVYRRQLSSKFRGLSDHDLVASGAHIISIKKND